MSGFDDIPARPGDLCDHLGGLVPGEVEDDGAAGRRSPAGPVPVPLRHRGA